MTAERITTPSREPGLYISVRVDHVRNVPDPYTLSPRLTKKETEVLADLTEQRMSPFVMAAMLRALADEINPPKPQF